MFIIIIFLTLGMVFSQELVKGRDNEVLNAKSPLKISTYDNSEQLNHPDVIYVKKGWNSYQYWMAFTPYPYENRRHENPSIRASHDGIHWEKPSELMPDPIVLPPPDSRYGGFNSDPDIILIDKIMVLFYRTTNKNHHTTVYFKTSNDGIKWSTAQLTNLPTTTTSPAFYYDGTKLRGWFVKYTGRKYRTYAIGYSCSKDGQIWSTSRNIKLVTPGYTPWHLNVSKTSKGFEMLLTAYPLGCNNGNTVLFHALSTNGLDWHLSRLRPLLQPVKDARDSKQIYRSAMIKDDLGYKIWYSAADINDKWGIGYIELKKFPSN